MPAVSIETPVDVSIVPQTSPLQRDVVRAGLIAMLQQANVADAVAAAFSFLLGAMDSHPHVVRKVLSAEVTRGSLRYRIIDVFNRGVR